MGWMAREQVPGQSFLGSKISFLDSRAKVDGQEALDMALDLLRRGEILGLKSLGGFHLVADASSKLAVEKLRKGKRRNEKPLGLMMSSMEEVKKYCIISSAERDALEDPRSPMVLVKRRKESPPLAPGISPNLTTLGVLLPYTPLQMALTSLIDSPLVMTSGNISGEPLCWNIVEAQRMLKSIARGFLVHDGPIEGPLDDTVLFCSTLGPHMVRRARAFSPGHFSLEACPSQLLATGGLLKNTFCLVKDEKAIVSHHLGDLTNPRAYLHYVREVKKFIKEGDIRPEFQVTDLHPDYPRDLPIRDGKLPTIKVQHHHAHIASGIVEFGLKGKVLGITYDGTGLGIDGAIWGGEFLWADLEGFTRCAHLEYFPLPGGDLAIGKPYRTALGLIYPQLGSFGEFVSKLNPLELRLATHQIKSGFNTPKTSSMGRLFDGVAALLGIRKLVDYDGQAPMELEALTTSSQAWYRYQITDDAGVVKIGVGDLLVDIYQDYLAGEDLGKISTKFHNTVVQFTVDVTRRIREKTRGDQVLLTGGCFQNRYLLEGISGGLERQGFEVFVPRRVPMNDGGLALGQGAIASTLLGKRS